MEYYDSDLSKKIKALKDEMEKYNTVIDLADGSKEYQSIQVVPVQWVVLDTSDNAQVVCKGRIIRNIALRRNQYRLDAYLNRLAGRQEKFETIDTAMISVAKILEDQ